MRYHQLLEKKIPDYYIPTLKEAKIFFNDNQKMLIENGNLLPVRGIGTAEQLIFSNKIENRKPLNTSQKVNSVLNKMYLDMGIEARRDNSIFVTNNKEQASGYGYTYYYVVPSNDYVYSYINGIRDFYLSIYYDDYNNYFNYSDSSIFEWKYKEAESFIKKNIKTSGIETFRGEVCLRASKYLFIREDYFKEFIK